MGSIGDGSVFKSQRYSRASLGAEVGALKRRVSIDRASASSSVRMKTFAALWDFAELRGKTTRELAEVVPFLRECVPLPEDMNLRLSKILLARCLLDQLAELRDATMRNPTLSRVQLFDITKMQVSHLLSKGYFLKGAARVKAEYRVAEIALAICSECNSVPNIPIETAMNREFARAMLLMDEF